MKTKKISTLSLHFFHIQTARQFWFVVQFSRNFDWRHEILCAIFMCKLYLTVMQENFLETKNQLPVDKKCEVRCHLEFLQTSNAWKKIHSIPNFYEIFTTFGWIVNFKLIMSCFCLRIKNYIDNQIVGFLNSQNVGVFTCFLTLFSCENSYFGFIEKCMCKALPVQHFNYLNDCS